MDSCQKCAGMTGLILPVNGYKTSFELNAIVIFMLVFNGENPYHVRFEPDSTIF